MSEIIRLQDEIRRLNAEIKDLATSNLEAQHRAALEGDRLRALTAEMLDALSDLAVQFEPCGCDQCQKAYDVAMAAIRKGEPQEQNNKTVKP